MTLEYLDMFFKMWQWSQRHTAKIMLKFTKEFLKLISITIVNEPRVE